MRSLSRHLTNKQSSECVSEILRPKRGQTSKVKVVSFRAEEEDASGEPAWYFGRDEKIHTSKASGFGGRREHDSLGQRISNGSKFICGRKKMEKTQVK